VLYGALNRKKAGWLLIIFATTCKSILTSVFSSYETDKSFYLLLSNNISEGKGLTIPVSLLNNPAVTENIFIPSASSPLYSILVAPLLKLFPGNYFLVTWMIETLSWLFLFIIAYKILRRLLQDYFWPNMFILFAGLFLYNIELSSSAKDVLSTGFLLAGFLQSLRLGSSQHISWISIILSSILFMLPGLTKSIYTPITFVFPLSILFIGLLEKKRIRIQIGLSCLLISLVLLGASYFYFHRLETAALAQYSDFFLKKWFMAKSGDDFIPGIYFENLLRLYPFIPASIFYCESSRVQFRDHLPVFYKAYGFFLYLFNGIGIAGLVAVFFSVCKRYYRKLIPLRNIFLLTGLGISFAILAITCFLSLRFQAIEYKGSTDSWTFVYENRPYFFIILFLQLSLFIFLFSQSLYSGAWKTIQKILLVILATGCLHGVYFVSRNVIRPTKMKTTLNQMISLKVDSVQKAKPPQQVLLVT